MLLSVTPTEQNDAGQIYEHTMQKLTQPPTDYAVQHFHKTPSPSKIIRLRDDAQRKGGDAIQMLMKTVSLHAKLHCSEVLRDQFP